MKRLTVGILIPHDDRINISGRAILAIRKALNDWSIRNSAPLINVVVELYGINKLSQVRSIHQNSNYDGVILLNTVAGDDLYLEQAGLCSVPIVLIQRDIPGQSWVGNNNEEVGYKVAAYFNTLGHEILGFIAPDFDSRAIDARLIGFRKYLALEKNDELTWDYVGRGYFSETGGYQATRLLIYRLNQKGKPFPTALFIAHDLMAVGVLQALKESGLRVPEDISVVSYDNDPIGSIISPTLTTVDATVEQVSIEATNILLDIIEGKVNPPVTRLFEPKLVIRSSSGPSRTTWQM